MGISRRLLKRFDDSFYDHRLVNINRRPTHNQNQYDPRKKKRNRVELKTYEGDIETLMVMQNRKYKSQSFASH